jgi:hypothetical protein
VNAPSGKGDWRLATTAAAPNAAAVGGWCSAVGKWCAFDPIWSQTKLNDSNLLDEVCQPRIIEANLAWLQIKVCPQLIEEFVPFTKHAISDKNTLPIW